MDKIDNPTETQVAEQTEENKMALSRRGFLGAGAVATAAGAIPMTAAMFAASAKAQASEIKNSAVVHPGELDEYYGFLEDYGCLL